MGAMRTTARSADRPRGARAAGMMRAAGAGPAAPCGRRHEAGWVVAGRSARGVPPVTGAAPATGTLLVPADPRAVRQARRLTAQLCAAAGLVGDLVETAVLLTSEVVTNAVIHGRSEATVAVTATAAEVLVEVGDDNSRRPVLQPQDEDALDGRGIGLLQLAADDWGVREAQVGKVVWFVLRAS